MFFRLLAAVFAAFLLSSAPAAAITYQYTGQTFTDFTATDFTAQPHDETMRITAQIELSSPLAANATVSVLEYWYSPVGTWGYNASSSFVSAQFSDGVNAFSIAYRPRDPEFGLPPVDPTPLSWATISLVTDSLGEIIDWTLEAALYGRYILPYGGLYSTPDMDIAKTLYGPDETSASVAAPGKWTVETTSSPPEVPLPASAWLLLAALGSLALIAHPKTREASFASA